MLPSLREPASTPFAGSLPKLRVTQALSLLGFRDDFGDQQAMDRGTAVHLATAYYDLGVLDETTLDPVCVPYVEAYKLFRREMSLDIAEGHGMQDKAIEEKVEIAEIQGTLDRRFISAGTNQHICCDIKSGTPARWHMYQVGLYSLLWSQQTDQLAPEIACLYLANTGKYRWVQFAHPWRIRQECKALITAALIALKMHPVNGAILDFQPEDIR